MYYGERAGVMPFFNSCGFALPARKGIADFLQEVTSRKDQGVRLFCAAIAMHAFLTWPMHSADELPPFSHSWRIVLDRHMYACLACRTLSMSNNCRLCSALDITPASCVVSVLAADMAARLLRAAILGGRDAAVRVRPRAELRGRLRGQRGRPRKCRGACTAPPAAPEAGPGRACAHQVRAFALSSHHLVLGIYASFSHLCLQ